MNIYQVVLSALVGALMGGVVQFALEIYRSRNYAKLRYQDKLVELRVVSCHEACRLLLAVEQSISPVRDDTTVIERPVEVKSGFDVEKNRVRERFEQAAEDLDTFLSENEVILGAEVLRCWYRYQRALTRLRDHQQRGERTKDLSLLDATFPALLHVADRLVDEMRECIRCALISAEFSLLKVEEKRVAVRTGHAYVDQLLQRIAEDPQSYSVETILENSRDRSEALASKMLGRKH